mmetsp:Transcript_17605/g.48605  ORF Transcript_17605/g.48605 Transcript_17605/m.48605 type:complete len:339 (-) Transcript_17605:61-1077(-)
MPSSGAGQAPVTTARIQGFGCEDLSQGRACGVARCLEGHQLWPWQARAGTCDGCGGKVKSGERVMDCRRCDYYLCSQCRPCGIEEAAVEEKEPSSDMWSAVKSLPGVMMDSATHHMATIAAEIEAFIFAPDSDDFLMPQRAQRDQEAWELREEAARLLAEFCDAAGEEPSAAELDALWSRCCLLYGCALQAGPIARAFMEQLRPTRAGQFSKDELQRRQLRALTALLHVHAQGEVGRELAGATARRGRSLLQRLSANKLPALAKRAAEVLEAIGLPLLAVDDLEDLGACSTTSSGPSSARSSGSGSSSSSIAGHAEAPAKPTDEPVLVPCYDMARLGA